jgi:hypothetical protein
MYDYLLFLLVRMIAEKPIPSLPASADGYNLGFSIYTYPATSLSFVPNSISCLS